MIAYLNGNYLPREEVHISPDDRGFLFADALYEVIRAYNGHILCLHEHLERLEIGAREIRFPRSSFPELAEVGEELIKRNGLTQDSVTLYIQLTRGVAPRGHAFPPEDTPMTIYMSADPVESDLEAQGNGIKVILLPDERWVRRDIKSTNRLANVLANQLAHDADAKEAIFVQEGVLLEGTHSSFCVVADGVLITHPRTAAVLPGTTARILQEEICPQLGIACQERAIMETEIETIDEAFVAGTITEVTPVIQVGERMVGDGKPGAVTLRLQAAFRDYVSNLDKNSK